MKKLLAIIVLGLLWSGNANSNELVGIKLECNFHDSLFRYFHFKSPDIVQTWIRAKTSKTKDGHNSYYNEGVRFIDIYTNKKKDSEYSLGTIDREALTFREGSLVYKCKTIDVEDMNIYLKDIFEKDSKSQKEKNKI